VSNVHLDNDAMVLDVLISGSTDSGYTATIAGTLLSA
jgi:hypothetical protein